MLMCPSGVACLPAGGYFRKLALLLEPHMIWYLSPGYLSPV